MPFVINILMVDYKSDSGGYEFYPDLTSLFCVVNVMMDSCRSLTWLMYSDVNELE